MPDPADVANEKGRRFADERLFADAATHYLEAARLAPGWEAPWFNLTIAYKHLNEWKKVLECSDSAARHDVQLDVGAWWNIGIAATALSDWPRAREAWNRCGVNVPSGDGPINMRLGPTPVRVNPGDAAEVVWCDRIDPARAIIQNVPSPKCGRRYKDLVLHDGEPVGKRRLRDRDVSVFNELVMLEQSPFATFELKVRAGDESELDDLLKRFEGIDGALEDWTSSIQMLCKACSEGNDAIPHQHEVEDTAWKPDRLIGIAARPAFDAQKIVDSWASTRWSWTLGRRSRKVISLERKL